MELKVNKLLFCIVLILIVLIISVLGFYISSPKIQQIFSGNSNTSSNSITSSKDYTVDSEMAKLLGSKEFPDLLYSIDYFHKFFINDSFKDTKLQLRISDLMAPLSVLDPISVADDTDKSDLLNVINGAISGQYLSKDEVNKLVEVPHQIANGQTDMKGYFQKNKSYFDNLNNSIDNSKDLNILSYWDSKIYRINQNFLDYETKNLWELPVSNSKYYDFRSISVKQKDGINNESLNFIHLLNDQNVDLLKQMKTLTLNTFYKCEDKKIFMSGTVDNVYGYVYGAKSAKEINCGLLKGRFNIITEIKLDDNWTYFVTD